MNSNQKSSMATSSQSQRAEAESGSESESIVAHPKSNSSTIAKMLAYRLTHSDESHSQLGSPQEISNDLRFRFTSHYQPWHSSLAPNPSLFNFITSSSPLNTNSTTTSNSTTSTHPALSATNSTPPAQCPMSRNNDHADSNNDAINPLNQMPNLSQKALSKSQKLKLSTERTVSSIPKSSSSPAKPDASPYDQSQPISACPIPHDQRSSGGNPSVTSPIGTKESSSSSSAKWEYPSPQQFYNALVRKGWATPEDSVETMVLIHNVLNERAWDEVIRWERELVPDCDSAQLSLSRFTGRPGTLSPKARVFNWLGWIMPNRFNSTPPFDRHDWIVRRSNGQEVRYVIDYYSDEDYDENASQPEASPDSSSTKQADSLVSKAESTIKKMGSSRDEEEEEDDEASFNLDVRPALDSFDSFRMRFSRTWREWKEGDGREERG